MTTLEIVGESLIEDHYSVTAIPLLDDLFEQSRRGGQIQGDKIEHDLIVWSWYIARLAPACGNIGEWHLLVCGWLVLVHVPSSLR